MPKPKINQRDIELAAKNGGMIYFAVESKNDFSLLEAAGGDGKKLPTFEGTAYTGVPMNLGFGRPVVIDLEGMTEAAGLIPALKQHDPTQIVGHQTVDISVTRIKTSGIVSGIGLAAQEVVALGKNQFPWQMSVGAKPDWNAMESIEAGQKVTVNRRALVGPLYVARKSVLAEISFVPIGADTATSASIAASYNQESIDMNFETWLKAKGFEAADLSDAQKVGLQASFDAEQKAEVEKAAHHVIPKILTASEPVVDPIAEMRLNASNEATRIAKVQKLTVKFPELTAQAIKDNWDETKIELEVLKASRPTGPAIHEGHHVAPNALVLECAMLQSGGLKGTEKLFDEKTLQAAHSAFKGRISLQEVLLEAAWAVGYTGRSFSRDMKGVLQAAFSNIDIPGILSNVVNKTMKEAFLFVENVWSEISAIGSVKDFKAVPSYSLVGDQMYELLAPTGDIKHGTIGQVAYTNQANTYAKLLTITRTDLINDDLGALMGTLPKRMGRGAALKINDVFWTAFMDNGSFFTTGNANFTSGATTNLSVDSLTVAEKGFLNQTDPESKPLGVSPKILLVAPANKVIGQQLYNAVELRDTTASTKFLTNNPHSGKFPVKCSAYLSNASYTGYSVAKWYLLADPNDLPVIETVFLNGQQTPTIETVEAEVNQLGIVMRGYHDFGVTKQEYRGGYATKGEA